MSADAGLSYDSEGILRDGRGAELARVEVVPDPLISAFARVTIAGDTYEIVKPSGLGRHFQLRDGAGEVIYDFRPGLRRGGTVRSAGGEELAKLLKRLFGTEWTITPEAGEPIVVKRREGFVGSVVSDDGRFVAPDLDVSVPDLVALDREKTRLLAFACWLIVQWDV